MAKFLVHTLVIGCLAAGLTGCGETKSTDDAAVHRDDAASTDGGGRAFDARVATDAAVADASYDARPPLQSAPPSEVTSSAGVMSGPTYKLEFQIGHPISQRPAVGGGKVIEGAAAIK